MDDLEGCGLAFLAFLVATLLGILVGDAVGSHRALEDTYLDQSGRRCIRLEMYKPTEDRLSTYGKLFDNDGMEKIYFCEVDPPGGEK